MQRLNITIRSLFFLFAAVSLTGHCGAAAEVTSENVSIGSATLEDFFVFDVGGDGKCELYLAQADGKVSSYDLDGNRLWEKSFSEKAISGGVIGDLMGTGAPVLALSGADGVVRYVWPGTGELIAEAPVNAFTSLRPSLASSGAGDPDRLVVCCDDGQLRVFAYGPAGIEPLFVIPNSAVTGSQTTALGRFSTAATCGDLDGDNKDEIATSFESGIIQVVPVADSAARYFYRLPQGTSVNAGMAIGPIGENAAPALVLTNNAEVQAVVFDKTPTPPVLRLLASGNPLGTPTGHVLLGQVSPEPALEIVSSSESSVKGFYIGQAPMGGAALLDLSGQSFSTVRPPLSPASCFPDAQGKLQAVMADNTGRLFAWNPAKPGDDARSYSSIKPTRHPTLTGDFTGSGKLTVVSYDSSAREILISTIEAEGAAKDGGTRALGANFYRNGQADGEQGGRIKGSREKMAGAFAKAKADYQSAQSSGDEAGARSAAAALAGINPADPEASAAWAEHGGGGTGWGRMLFLIVAAAAVLAGIMVTIFRTKARKTKHR